LNPSAIAPGDDDTSAPDSAISDSGFDVSTDAPMDTGGLPIDTGTRDTSTMDTSTMDTSTPDTSAPDTGCPDRDGDGSCDDVDPCPDDAPDDSDGDGVCDSDDACPGDDDRIDVDGDGRPDGCDPCLLDGPSATPIPGTVTNTGITISDVSLNGGGNVAVVNGGDSVSVSLDYDIVDCGCSTCIDQIEIGLVPDMSFQYCAYSAVPGCGGDMGSDTGTLRAPPAPGIYYVRFGRAQNFSCTHTNWWQGSPPTARTIGAICVR